MRQIFIENALWFAEAATRLSGILRIALIGSLTTPKPKPKDVDLLVTIAEGTPLQPIAGLGRKLSGRQLGLSSGADVFLANEKGDYLGRTCSHRECHPRATCEGSQCNGSYLRNDFHLVRLERELIASPPVELFPKIVIRDSLPVDLLEALEALQKKLYPHQPITKEYPHRRNTNQLVTDTWSNHCAEALYKSQWEDEPETLTLYESGRQCGGCAWFAPFNADWGLCCHRQSRHFTETVFEHFTCPVQKEEGWGAHSFSEGGRDMF